MERNEIAFMKFRNTHQPLRSVERQTLPSAKALSSACKNTVALILANNVNTKPLKVRFEDPEKEAVVCESKDPLPRPLQLFNNTPLITHVAACAVKAHLAHIAVLAGGDAKTQNAIGAAAKQGAKAADDTFEKTSPIPIVPYRKNYDRTATVAACGFEVFGITKGILDVCIDLLEAYPDTNSVLVLSADQVRITPSHLYELCSAFQKDTSLDIGVSWIEWLARTPILFSRAFLEGLESSPLIRPRPESTFRPLPSLRVRTVLFGEELLSANANPPEAVEQFFKECTLSARGAVQKAHDVLCSEKNGKTSDAADIGTKEHTAAVSDEKHSEADSKLLSIARRVISSVERDLTSKERCAVKTADAWAQRNRSDFPLLLDRTHKDTLAYLDSAATTQRVFRALQAQKTFDEHENANIYRGMYDLSMQATVSYNDARKALEDHIGADRRQTVFTANTTASCNLVAQAWGEHHINEGDMILVTLAEHHSNLLPWLMLAQRKGACLAYIPILPDGRIDLNTYEELLAKHPKLVCVAHIGNVLGMIAPIKKMARAAHTVGARFLVDAAQSISRLPIDVKELGADFVAFSAHKMYGPLGIGGLWIHPEAFDEMDPLASGGGAISHVGRKSYYLRQGAIQYELGTPAISAAIGWGAAAEYLDNLGMDAIQEHDEALTRLLMAGLETIDGLTVWGDHSKKTPCESKERRKGSPEAVEDEGATGLVSFSLAGIPQSELGIVCGKLGVAIRVGGHCALPLAESMGLCGTGRISMGVHTTREDIEAALVAIEVCRHLYWEL